MILIVEGLLFGPWIALGRDGAPARRVRTASSRRVRRSSATSSSERRPKRASACCKRRSSRTSCSIRSRTCRRSSTPDRRARPACSRASSPICARRCRVCRSRRRRSATSSSSCARISKSCTCECPTGCSSHCESTSSWRARCCPAMTLLTLVENAVRHGIDPSEEGGRIDVEVRAQRRALNVHVTDTGVGSEARQSRPRLGPRRCASA